MIVHRNNLISALEAAILTTFANRATVETWRLLLKFIKEGESKITLVDTIGIPKEFMKGGIYYD